MNGVKINKPGKSVQQFHSAQRGISLLDAMIAVVIFSVGMLAIAALQTISKTSNFEAIQRSHASSLAYDLLERMRMNSGSNTNYVSSTTITITDQTYTPCSAGCDQAAMAVNDLYEWKQALLGAAERNPDDSSVGGLVNPTACLDGPSSPPGEYTLTIVWRGQTSITNQSTNTCGSGTGLYDASSTDDFAYRRILVINTYL